MNDYAHDGIKPISDLTPEELEQIKSVDGSKPLTELEKTDVNLIGYNKTLPRDTHNSLVVNKDKIREEIKKLKQEKIISIDDVLDFLRTFDLTTLELQDLLLLKLKCEDAMAKKIGYKNE